MAGPDFPYKYNKIHPFLHQPTRKNLFIRIFTFISVVTSPILATYKLFAAAVILGGGALLCRIINLGTDQTVPLPPFRRLLFNIVEQLMFRLQLLSQFVLVFRKNKKKINKNARVLVSNHQNMNDVMIHCFMHGPVFLARSDMFDAYGIGQVLHCSRSLKVDKHKSNADLLEHMQLVVKSKMIQIFPEGTISAENVLLRLRPGAFKLDQLVQPVAIKYYTFLPIAWLCESGFRHLWDLASNLFTIAIYQYLDVVDNETPDQCGKRMASAMGAQYVPYTNQDYLWFSGQTQSNEKCTPEYLEDFGWMGQYKNYVELCKSTKKNPKYYWDQKTLGLE